MILQVWWYFFVRYRECDETGLITETYINHHRNIYHHRNIHINVKMVPIYRFTRFLFLGNLQIITAGGCEYEMTVTVPVMELQQQKKWC